MARRTLMGAFLRAEAAGMATTVDDKSGEPWLPKLYSVFYFKQSFILFAMSEIFIIILTSVYLKIDC